MSAHRERYLSGNVENIDVLVVDGKSEAREFLLRLKVEDSDAWDKFRHVFKLRCEGLLTNKAMFHAIKGVKGVFEFKARGLKLWRMYCFREGRCWVLTHGVEKPHDKKVVCEGRKCLEKKNLLEGVRKL
jgi:hypothetical protein